MIFGYGSYRHPPGTVGLTVQKRTEENDAQQQLWTTETWTIEGRLTSRLATEVLCRLDIKAKSLALVAAYSVRNQAAVLYMPDGVTWSHHALIPANTIGGVRVLDPVSFPESRGVEGVTMRKFRVVLEAIVPYAASNPNVARSFSEEIEIMPAGERYGHLETLIGPPVKQRLRAMTVYRARQSGQAVGVYHRPSPPMPIWPAALVESQPGITKRSPRRIGNSHVDFGISWSYEFESSTPLLGAPHVWGINW